jgi:acetolactate synthase-1/2/3 large subunit
MTTTSAIDRIHSSSSVYAGRPGTWGGQRAANLLIAQADLVIAVGAQLDLQMLRWSLGVSIQIVY